MQSFRGIQVSPHSLLCITCFCLWSIKLEEAPSWICILDGFRHYVNVSAVLIVYIFWVQVLVYGSLYVSCKFPFLWVVTVWSIDRMTYHICMYLNHCRHDPYWKKIYIYKNLSKLPMEWSRPFLPINSTYINNRLIR